jgi:hypothetical protein
MAGFTCVGVLGGGSPRIGSFTVKASDTFVVGEMAILTSNEAAEGTSGAPAFIGVAVETVDNTVDGHSIRCFLDPYAIYQYNDGTAHAAGATLDMASGGLGLASDSNHDFTVICDNIASEPTTFIITPGNHYLHTGG